MPRFIQLTMVNDDNVRSFSNPTPGPAPLPTVVDAERIRNVHPRKGGRPGTRVVFHSGAAMPVTESYADVVRLLTDGAITPAEWAAGEVLDEDDEDRVEN